MVFFFLFLFFQHTLHINVFVCRSPFIFIFGSVVFFFFSRTLSSLPVNSYGVCMRNHCDEHTHGTQMSVFAWRIFSRKTWNIIAHIRNVMDIILLFFFLRFSSIFGCFRMAATIAANEKCTDIHSNYSRFHYSALRSSASLLVFTVHFHIFRVHFK